MTRNGIFALATLLLAAFALPAVAQEPMRVVGTIPDLVDIARQVGGERIEADTIAVGYQDPHYVDPKPSFVVKLNYYRVEGNFHARPELSIQRAMMGTLNDTTDVFIVGTQFSF